MREVVTIGQEKLDQIVQHALQEYPKEACGIVAGRENEAMKIYPVTNKEQSPITYFMEPSEQFTVIKEMRKNGWQMLGIYHSHTSSDAYPSEKDIELAFYQDALHFIVSLKNLDKPYIKVYWIANGQVNQEGLNIQE